MWGKTEQVRTTGAQLIPFGCSGDLKLEQWKEVNGAKYFLYKSGEIEIRKTGGEITPTSVFVANDIYLDPGKYVASAKGTPNISMSAQIAKIDTKENIKTFKITTNTTQPVAINENEYIKYIWFYFRSEPLEGTIYAQLQKGEEATDPEPYSGGFPSPSPDWEQPIEVTDHPVTVTIKGGTEQQSVTLVPPRPLTKWDKLEKVDGTWMWVYNSGTATLKGDAEEYWKKSTTNNPEKHRFYPMMLKDKIVKCANDKIADIYCTSYIAVSANDTYTASKNGVSIQSDGALLLYDEAYSLMDIDGLMQALANNPITVYYESVDTEYIPLPQPVQDKLNALTMYAGTTEIANDGGCTMELTYTVDTKFYVDTKIAEISKAIL